MNDKAFLEELRIIQRDYIGRETPLYFAPTATKLLGGAQIYIKLEGLANTGAHKINNAIGQCLLAKKMGKTRIIAETGAGQHGLATAAACAKLGLECIVYMGEVDVRRQQPNVAAMELYGAKVCAVTAGSRTLKDAVNEACATGRLILKIRITFWEVRLGLLRSRTLYANSSLLSETR